METNTAAIDAVRVEPETSELTNAPVLHVVGQHKDGHYELATLHVPIGKGVDVAAEWCARKGLKYIVCSRAK